MGKVNVSKLILDLLSHGNCFSRYFTNSYPQALCGVSTRSKDDHSVIRQEEGLRSALGNTLASYATMLTGDLVSVRGRRGRNVIDHMDAIPHEHDQLVFLIGEKAYEFIR